MSVSFLRGVLLPLIFFLTLPVFAQTSISELYDVFYKDIKSYVKWVKSDRQNTFKDIFIDLYNLPLKNKRKYSNDVKIKVIKGLSNSSIHNAYMYLEFNQRKSVNLVIWGVKKGSIKINGAIRGKIDIDHDTGFSLLKGTFEKGVYFISINITERFVGVPVKVLSDKKLRMSKRGFNRNAACTTKLYNIKARYPKVDLSSIYSGYCFPYSKDEDRETFYSLTLKKDFSAKSTKSLFFGLYSLTVNDKRKSDLKKLGFDEDMIKWWKKRLFEKEVCGYE